MASSKVVVHELVQEGEARRFFFLGERNIKVPLNYLLDRVMARDLVRGQGCGEPWVRAVEG